MTSDAGPVAHVGVAVFGRDGRLLLHTPRFAELVADADGPIEPRCSLEGLLRRLGGDEAACAAALHAHQAPPSLRCITEAGRAVDIAFEILPQDRCCMTVTDVTEAHAARLELQRARRAAEAASHAKSTFLATMSHELRTPLHAVIGFSSALIQETAPAADGPDAPTRLVDPALVAEFSEAIHQAGQHLLERINTIIDVARIESGQFDLAADLIEIDYMLQLCRRQLDQAARAANVSLVTDIAPQLPRLRADERRLRQVIGHLLTNALKFTPAGGEVVLGARCEVDGGLAIMVRDSGIGIPADDIERVFEPFNQLDAGLARRRSGAGLGLYASRFLVTAHDGTITLTSTPGRGTTATVRLPAARLEHAPLPLELTQDPP